MCPRTTHGALLAKTIEAHVICKGWGGAPWLLTRVSYTTVVVGFWFYQLYLQLSMQLYTACRDWKGHNKVAKGKKMLNVLFTPFLCWLVDREPCCSGAKPPAIRHWPSLGARPFSRNVWQPSLHQYDELHSCLIPELIEHFDHQMRAWEAAVFLWGSQRKIHH